MTTSLRSPPKSTFNVESLIKDNDEDNDADVTEDPFAFEFQEISDKELNLVVKQIEDLEIEHSDDHNTLNLAASVVEKDSIGSSCDSLGSPLLNYAKQSVEQETMEVKPETKVIQSIKQIVASIDEWETLECKSETGESRPCFDSLKKLVDY